VKRISRRVAAALRLSPVVILRVGLPRVREPRRARSLATHLVRIAASVLRQSQASQIYVEGGATAIELVRRMGWKRLMVLREIALGVAAFRVAAARPLCLTMKPGSYTWPDQIRKLLCQARP